MRTTSHLEAGRVYVNDGNLYEYFGSVKVDGIEDAFPVFVGIDFGDSVRVIDATEVGGFHPLDFKRDIERSTGRCVLIRLRAMGFVPDAP